MARKTGQLTVGRRRIAVSNLEKILYPGTRFTRAKVIDYYVNVSKYLLPHLKDRPVTLKRFPEGVFGEAFYEKDAPAPSPGSQSKVRRDATARKGNRAVVGPTRAEADRRGDAEALAHEESVYRLESEHGFQVYR